ncbi:MAG: universal stress protein [Cyanobacteria bacterium HKST-UBA02]|nr:universal stress protein [Cyanobacteria bacterium HKST-UBA02]
MNERILIPVDDQPCSYAALASLRARRWIRGTEFLLLKVVESYRDILGSAADEHVEALEIEQRDYAHQMGRWLDEMTENFGPNWPDVESLLEYGVVPDKIAKVAFGWQANHIMIGSHDLDLATRFALGSTASSVAGASPCSLEVIRSRPLKELLQEEGEITAEDYHQLAVPPRRILVATDLSSASRASINWIGSCEWAPVTLFRVVTVAVPEHKDQSLADAFCGINKALVSERRHRELVRSGLKEESEQIARLLSDSRVEFKVLQDDDPAGAIITVADDWDAQLIIMGMRGAETEAAPGAGPTAMSVLERAHCSVALIQNDSTPPASYSWRRPMLITGH